MRPQPDFPFTSDGCSGGFMRLVHFYWKLRGKHELSANVRALCVEHDRAYHPGGTRLQRVEADAALMLGVARLGQHVLARWMIPPVGIFGHWLFPFPWRWGYGWPWPRRYDQ